MKRFLSSSALRVLVLGLAAFGILSLGASGALALRSPAALAGALAEDGPSPNAYHHARAAAHPGNHLAATEEQDDKAAFRHSVVVRGVGRLLHLEPEPAARLFEYFNFALLAGAGLYFFVMYFPAFLRQHRAAIQKQLVEARSASEQANSRLRAVEERFRRLDDEIRSIREQAERESAAEETRIKALIETARQRIVASAEQEIAAAASAARRDLKRFAGELAVDRARRTISLSGEEDRALIRNFAPQPAPQLGQSTRNGGPY